MLAQIGEITLNPRLRTQQRAFVEQYLTVWNASEAARRAGYGKNSDVSGSKLLDNPKIILAIQERLKQLRATSDESVVDLTRMARGGMQFFLDAEAKGFNLWSEQAVKNHDLIKKVTFDESITTDEDGRETRHIKTSLEVVDKLAARTVLVKVQGLLAPDVMQGTTTNNTLVIQSLEQAQDSGIDIASVMSELQRMTSGNTTVTTSPPPILVIEQTETIVNTLTLDTLAPEYDTVYDYPSD